MSSAKAQDTKEKSKTEVSKEKSCCKSGSNAKESSSCNHDKAKCDKGDKSNAKCTGEKSKCSAEEKSKCGNSCKHSDGDKNKKTPVIQN